MITSHARVALVACISLYPFCTSAQEVNWNEVPPSVQEIAKLAATGNLGDAEVKGTLDKISKRGGKSYGMIHGIDLAGVTLFEKSFGGGRRGRIQEVRTYKSEEDIDIYYVNHCRKVVLSKNADMVGRVRVLIILPGTKAKGKDGELGYPEAFHNRILGPQEEDRVRKDLGNVMVIISPIEIPKESKENQVYYHIEWNE